jgi:hypothetical protein
MKVIFSSFSSCYPSLSQTPCANPLALPTGGVDRRLVATPRLPHRQPLLGMTMTPHTCAGLFYGVRSSLPLGCGAGNIEYLGRRGGGG